MTMDRTLQTGHTHSGHRNFQSELSDTKLFW